jgi:type IV pilus assembly protein PilO
MLSRLSGQNIALLIIGLSVVVAAIWYFTLYSNTLAESDVVRTEITALNDKKLVGERARANVVQLCQVVTDLQRQKAEFLRALPSSEQFSSLLNTLRIQVSATRGQINSIGRSSGAAAGAAVPAGVKAINVTMALDGTLDSIRGLLLSLEQQQRFLRVENLSLAQSSVQFGQNNQPVAAGNPLLASQMTMTAYIYDAADRNSEAAPINPVCQTVPGAEVPR